MLLYLRDKVLRRCLRIASCIVQPYLWIGIDETSSMVNQTLRYTAFEVLLIT